MMLRCSTRAATGLLLLFGFACQALAADWTYTVRPGDDLWRLAAKYCGSTSFARRLAQHNGLARPQALQAGARLAIPVEWLVKQPAAVEVLSVSGSVSDANGRSLSAGDRLEMGATVITGNGFAVLTFADGSTLQVGKNSEVLLNVLTVYGDTGMVDTHLRFYKGRGAAAVIKQQTNSKFRIWTPSGIAAVRGTDFRIGARPGNDAEGLPSTRLETVTGAVDFDDDTNIVDVPAGFGVIASTAGINKEELLAAPVFVDASKPLWRPDEFVRWQADAAASAYRVTVYEQGPRGARPIRSSTVRGPEFQLADLAAGAYTFAVRAVAASGLEGFDSQTPLVIGAQAPVASTEVDLLPTDSLRWRPLESGFDQPYEVQIARSASFDGASSYSSESLALRLSETMAAKPGRYHWRVKRADSAYSEPREVAVHPLPVETLMALQRPQQSRSSTHVAQVNWSGRADETYTLSVTTASARGGAGVRVYQADTLRGTSHDVPNLAPGRYRVQLTAYSGDLASEPRAAEFVVRGSTPWWVPTLALTPLLFLL